MHKIILDIGYTLYNGGILELAERVILFVPKAGHTYFAILDM